MFVLVKYEWRICCVTRPTVHNFEVISTTENLVEPTYSVVQGVLAGTRDPTSDKEVKVKTNFYGEGYENN